MNLAVRVRSSRKKAQALTSLFHVFYMGCYPATWAQVSGVPSDLQWSRFRVDSPPQMIQPRKSPTVAAAAWMLVTMCQVDSRD